MTGMACEIRSTGPAAALLAERLGAHLDERIDDEADTTMIYRHNLTGRL